MPQLQFVKIKYGGQSNLRKWISFNLFGKHVILVDECLKNTQYKLSTLVIFLIKPVNSN